MARPSRLGLGLHGGPETRVRAVPVKRTKPTASVAADANEVAAPVVERGAAPPKAKKKLVVTLKVKSAALKKLFKKRAASS